MSFINQLISKIGSPSQPTAVPTINESTSIHRKRIDSFINSAKSFLNTSFRNTHISDRSIETQTDGEIPIEDDCTTPQSEAQRQDTKKSKTVEVDVQLIEELGMCSMRAKDIVWHFMKKGTSQVTVDDYDLMFEIAHRKYEMNAGIAIQELKSSMMLYSIFLTTSHIYKLSAIHSLNVHNNTVPVVDVPQAKEEMSLELYSFYLDEAKKKAEKEGDQKPEEVPVVEKIQTVPTRRGPKHIS